ncbi:sugar phosphate isomerase/epimerase [Roseibium sp. RKSG952]|uniref:sugar phosphate isomerase/epimerase family protein n=1 Tax=Roseibium sp. RKSG952 TaxID=2529384 RepID=UPI0012BC6967|nr:sugar phosphate isomerase/epimerase family protein [Roseibium sp. RKSG952]MTH98479.1 sugar phosphate isomerase/epimerase [Roseibium sp. RKSG952]
MTKLKVGAALMVADLKTHRDWLVDGQRDLEIQDFFSPNNLGDAAGDLITAAKNTLQGYSGRLGIHGPFYDLPLDCHDPEMRIIVQKRMQQALDIAAKLGATQMVLHSPYSTWDYHNLDSDLTSREAKISRVHETLSPVVARAEEYGVVLVIENIEDKNPFDRVILANSFNSDFVRVSLDTGHAHYAHGATGAPPVDYYVRAAGDRLAHIHLQDADGYADRHWAPGQGSINWQAAFEAIAEAASQARLVLELRDSNDVMSGFEHLLALGLAE